MIKMSAGDYTFNWIKPYEKKRKIVASYAQITKNTIRLYSVAPELFSKLDKVMLGIDSENKVVAIKAYEPHENKAFFETKQYERNGSVTIQCTSFIQETLKELGVYIYQKQRLRVPVLYLKDDDLLILDISKVIKC